MNVFRNVYPPYGFYVLNRTGVMDYNQPLLPEDFLWQQKSFMMIKCYPQFTEKRLSVLGDQPRDIFDPAYKIDVDNLPEDKGLQKLIGLWIFTKDSREPLFDVIQRYAFVLYDSRDMH